MKSDYVMDPTTFDRTAEMLLGLGKNAHYGNYSIISSYKSNDFNFRWPRRELITRDYIPLLLPNGT
eukprot:765968-Hanusia_phi.AAC.6